MATVLGYVIDSEFKHWDEVGRYFGTAFVVCLLQMWVVAPALLSWVAPKRWKAMTEQNRVSAAMDLSQIFPAVLTTWKVWAETAEATAAVWADPATAPYMRAGPGVAGGAGACLGYMAAHCVFLVARYSVCSVAMGPFYWVTWVHHGLSLAVWPIGLGTSSYNFWIAWFLFSEVSNVFMDPRELLLGLGLQGSALFLPISVVWVASFTLSRIAPMPFLVWAFVAADWSRMPALHKVTGHVTVPLPLVLNLYWFVLIVKGVLALVSGDASAASRASNTDQASAATDTPELRRRAPSSVAAQH
eukprot:TRINITY_DN42901_c0_g1_i1.p1 TRINITY_DN42901_c0_g1~~TRINITY_DN42901_c0_g1_i1.p1  ORF type:complete len:301 (+),score=66.72 TRINITY_DN42901_c0_g1_i1:59-961(+)